MCLSYNYKDIDGDGICRAPSNCESWLGNTMTFERFDFTRFESFFFLRFRLLVGITTLIRCNTFSASPKIIGNYYCLVDGTDN